MTSPDNGPPKILIVDDTAENLEIVGGLLEKNHYDIYLADSGQAVLDLLPHIAPDLILMDGMMPDLDGFETCRRIRAIETYDDIPIIFLTARIDIESLIKGFESGAVDYIRKPFNSLELLARIKTHVELKRIRRELELAAAHDPLTGLLNKREMRKKIDYEQARFVRNGEVFAILAVQIVNFRAIVDGCGRTGGDQLLKTVASHLQANIREMDFISRWDGEQFLLLLPETGAAGAAVLLQRLDRILAEQITPCPLSGLVPALAFGSQVYSQEMNQQHFVALAFRNLADRLTSPASRNEPDGDLSAIRRLRVLAAEDDDMNRLLLTRIFERYGVPCRVVENGLAAVDAFTAEPFDVVFLDLQMPVMDGWHAARQIRSLVLEKQRPPVCLAALSGNRPDRVQSSGSDVAFDFQLLKPFTPEDVRQLLFWAANDPSRSTGAIVDGSGAFGPNQFNPRQIAPDPFIPDPFEPVPVEPEPDKQYSLANMESVLAKVNGDLQLLLLLLAKFQKNSAANLAAARAAAVVDDFPDLARTAHDLKGSLAIFNAFTTMELANQLEQIGRERLDEADEKIVQLLNIIELDIKKVIASFTAYIDECQFAKQSGDRHD